MKTTTTEISLDERATWAALASELDLGARSFAQLLSHGLTLVEVWQLPNTDLRRLGISAKVVEATTRARQRIPEPRAYLDHLGRKNIKVLTLKDQTYPARLAEISDPPAVLHVRGEITEAPMVAIVGSRKMTRYGAQVAEDLAIALVESDCTVVSGLAIGIDGAAHRATVKAGGRTIGILASGVDDPYPASHRELAKEIIAQKGALVSEFPPGTPALRHHFPVRNRIIAGLSIATIVVEAAEKSGSLLTARSALEANRDVFAVPGSIYGANSAGPHHLIQSGAKLVHRPVDVIHELGLELGKTETKARAVIPDTAEEAAILAALMHEPKDFDQLVIETDLDPKQLLSSLTLMEMKGRVRNLGGNTFMKR